MSGLLKGLIFLAFSFATSSAYAFAVTAYGGTWQQSFSGDLIDKDGPKDVESTLDIQDNWNLEAGVTFQTQDGWIPNFRLGVLEIGAKGRNTVSENGSLDILGIPVVTGTGSADIFTEIDYLVWHSGIHYDFKYERFDLQAGVTLNYVDGSVTADVDYDATAEGAGRTDERRENSTQSVIPTLYAAARTRLDYWLFLNLRAYGATTGDDGVGQVAISFEADLGDGVLLHGGYQHQTVDFYDEETETGLDVTVKGPFAGISYRFGSE